MDCSEEFERRWSIGLQVAAAQEGSRKVVRSGARTDAALLRADGRRQGGRRPLERDKERIVPAIAIAMRWEGCVFHQVEAARLTERSAKKRSSHHVWRISADADLSYWDGSCPRIRPVRTQIVSLHLFAQMVPRLVHAQGASAFWRRRG